MELKKYYHDERQGGEQETVGDGFDAKVKAVMAEKNLSYSDAAHWLLEHDDAALRGYIDVEQAEQARTYTKAERAKAQVDLDEKCRDLMLDRPHLTYPEAMHYCLDKFPHLAEAAVSK